MIGDHKQLSPFGSERIIRLLQNPDDVINALMAGNDFVSKSLRDPAADDIIDQVHENLEDFPALCALAIDCQLLFERLIEREFGTQTKKPKSRKIAVRLSEQHRMHPSIARLISRCFYENELESHQSAQVRFSEKVSPVISADTKRLPNAPLVWIDMPYVQNTIGLTQSEQHPRWHNPDEIDAVVDILGLLKPNPKSEEKPSLAVLSPYSEQVRRMRQRVDENLSSLPQVSQFQPAVSSAEYCGTVDSFQGNEADVVIVSLVRNNHHSGKRSSLGFLSDFRRMNVLLSRAKWRLILVASSDFIRHVIDATSGSDSEPDITFLSEILSAFEDERTNGNAVVMNRSRLR